MADVSTVKDRLTRIYRRIAGPAPASEFQCGDCERWAHCGLPPRADCVAKAAQIAEGRTPRYTRLDAGYTSPDHRGI